MDRRLSALRDGLARLSECTFCRKKLNFSSFLLRKEKMLWVIPAAGCAVLTQGCGTGRRRPGVTFPTTSAILWVHQNSCHHRGVLFLLLFVTASFRTNLSPAQNSQSFHSIPRGEGSSRSHLIPELPGSLLCQAKQMGWGETGREDECDPEVLIIPSPA